MKHCALLVALVLCSVAGWASVPNPHADYVSGSAAIPNGTGGTLNLGDSTELRFDYEDGAFRLPYERITSIELAAKPGMKALLASAMSWVPRYGRKQGRLLTLAYKGDKGAGEAATFEIGKVEFQSIASLLESRTGKHVHYLDIDQPENADTATPPPAPASTMVSVTFNSTPRGATVTFWGQSAGATPLTTKLTPGSYTVQITAGGLPAWTREIVVEPGKPLTIDADLGQVQQDTVVVSR